MGQKTDNKNLPAKLAIRRMMLDKYHKKNPPSVLECCQGEGIMWDVLEKEYALSARVGFDLKPKKGRGKIDSTRVVGGMAHRFDIIDIDTYGWPWGHWAEVVSSPKLEATTIFLTMPQRTVSPGGTISLSIAESLGIGEPIRKACPSGFASSLSMWAESMIIGKALVNGFRIVGIFQSAPSNSRCKYMAVRLDKEA